MRRASNLDSNHREIVLALQAIGASVQSLASMGGGVPDLLVGYHGVNVLLEVKDGDKPASARKMTKDEKEWHENWGGQVALVETPEQAQLEVIRICVPTRVPAKELVIGDFKNQKHWQDPAWCYLCDRPKNDCACELEAK